VTTYFKHFEEQSIEQAEEKKQWIVEEKALLNALRAAVDKAFQKKKLTDQQAVKYFQSSKNQRLLIMSRSNAYYREKRRRNPG
jgi:hypothetical protein